MVEHNPLYSQIYKMYIGAKTKYYCAHVYGEKALLDFINRRHREMKKAEHLATIRGSDNYRNDLDLIVDKANQGEINEEQLKTMIQFVRNKITLPTPK